jgi:hypothetical protein
MIDPNSLNLNTPSPLSLGSRTGITSPGSGTATHQNVGYNTSSTDLTGAGALLGALVANLPAGGAGAAPGSNLYDKYIKPLLTAKNVTPSGSSVSGGAYTPAGGYPDRGGTTTPTPEGTPIGGGNTGVPVGLVFPADTTQADIDAIYPPINGQSQFLIAGRNMSDGSIIAQTNYNIGPDFTPVLGQSDLFTGGGWDMSNPDILPGVDMGISDIVDNFGDYSFVLPDINVSPGYDSSWLDNFDPSNIISNDFISSIGSGGSSGSDSSWLDNLDVSNIMGTGGGGSSGWNWDFGFNKGGLATPLYKTGGKVQHFARGSSVTENPFTNNSTSTNTTDNTTDNTDMSNWLSSIFSNFGGTAMGAGLGALLANAFGPTSSTVSTGVDMSKVGNIAPRTTSFGIGPTPYIPYTSYGQPTGSPNNAYNDLYSNLGMSGYTPTAPNNSFYTFGTNVNPSNILNTGLKNGGLPHQSGSLLDHQQRMDYRHGSYVEGPGDGQSDDIPAMLADGEYVIDAETVAQLGNGSNKAGAKMLDEFRENIRAHKRSAPHDKIPPKSKSPLAYLKGTK